MEVGIYRDLANAYIVFGLSIIFFLLCSFMFLLFGVLIDKIKNPKKFSAWLFVKYALINVFTFLIAVSILAILRAMKMIEYYEYVDLGGVVYFLNPIIIAFLFVFNNRK